MGAGYKDLPPFVVNYGITGCFNDLRTRYSKSGGNTQTRDAAAIFGCCVPHFLFAISSRFQRLFSLVERKTYGQLGFHARKPCCKPLFMPLNSDFNPLFRRPLPAHAILSRPLPPVRSALPYLGLHRYSARQRCCWKARRVHIPLPHLSYRYKE